MLDGIPFRAPCEIVADFYRESMAVAELFLQMLLKAARPAAITASCISEDQQLFGLGNRWRPASSHQRTMAATANSGVSADVHT